MADTHPSDTYLLDPKNDYVFKRLFTEHPRALIQLINDLRPDLTAVTEVEILNPTITPSEMRAKALFWIYWRRTYRETAIISRCRFAVTMNGASEAHTILRRC